LKEIVLKNALLRNKLLEEIAKIPDNKVPELYHVIHDFRIAEDIKENNSDKILKLAGSWCDMPDDVFNELMAEIKSRRSTAFSSRRNRETSVD